MTDSKEQQLGTYVAVPLTSSEIKESVAEGEGLQELAREWVLDSIEEENEAGEMFKAAHDEWKRLDDLRKKATTPALDAQRTINALFKPALDAWKGAKLGMQRLLSDAAAVREAENQRRLHEAAAGDATALTKMVAEEPPKGTTYKKKWKVHVDDFDALPREFTCIDWSALQIHADKGLPAPPGVRFELISKPMVGKS
jgi:hypothetical protein